MTRRPQQFTVSDIDIPPIGVTGAPGDTVQWPADTARAIRATSPGAPGEAIRCDGVDPAIATVEARLCGPTGGSPGAWAAISTGSGLATGASAGAAVYFQLRAVFTARSDDENYRLYPSVFLTEAAHANGA